MNLILAQGVKDLALLQLWGRSQLWLRFNPRSGNVHILRVRPEMKQTDKQKKQKKTKKQQKKREDIHT